MRPHLYFLALLVSLATSAARASQTTSNNGSAPAAASSQKTTAREENTPAPAKPGYSKEPFVEEEGRVKVALQNNGTSTRETYDRIRIQSDAGVQHYSVMTFPYESATQALVIDYVRVRKPDGTVVVTPADSIQDMPAEITRQAPIYSDLREKQVAVKGLGVGDVIEALAHWQTTKPLAPGQFWFSFNFVHDYIILHEELQISVPKGRAIKYDSPGYQPTVVVDGDREILTWTYSQLQSKSAEDQKKEQDEQTYETAIGQLPPPDVQISSFQSWAEVGAWYDALQRDRVTPDADIRARAAELTKGAADENAKLRAIYEYVSTQVHYIGVAFGIGRIQPHSAGEILANQYGDCKDKHMLLASLLAAVGIQAYPALINTTHRLDPAVPSPAQFDHMITAVPQANGFVWLDTTPEVSPYGYLLSMLREKNSLVIPDGKPAELVLTPSSTSKALETFQIDGTLSSDGTLKAKVQRTISGDDTEVLLRSAFRSVGMTQWKDLVQKLSYLTGFAGDVSDVSVSPPEKIDEPLIISYNYTRKDFPQWSEHRIAVALPPTMAASSDEKPSHPILLGQAGLEVHYESRIVLPSGYAPQLPAAVDLDEPFATYHASYSLDKGALKVERTLIAKMREVPLADFDAYKSFSKTVGDDYTLYIGLTPTHVTVASYQDAIWALPYSPNPAAARAYDDARDDYNKHDLDGEITSLKRAVEIDPKFTRAWLWLGNIYAFERKTDEAIAALRSAVANDPQQALAYKGLGFMLMSAHKFDEAASVWKQLMQVAPNDPDGPADLGATLSSAKRYGEAATALESAIKLNAESAPLYTQLGSAYLQAGEESKALAAYRKALDIDSSALYLNNIGYALADADKQLSLALEYAQKAVQEEEEAASKIKLSELKDADLAHPSILAAYWDTLGWVYFRMGKLDDAEKYLSAAWVLSQATDMGDHLAQVYAKEHKKKEAIHTFRQALSTTRDPELTREMTNHLLELGSSPEDDPLKFDGGAELSHLRTFDLPGLTNIKGTAEFFLLFGPGANGSKLQDVIFIRGSDELKDAGRILSSVNFNVLFPDNGPERLVRRGIVTCDPIIHCSAVLYPPNLVRSVN
jgi:tetratricopeptide (TPR) repeat protein